MFYRLRWIRDAVRRPAGRPGRLEAEVVDVVDGGAVAIELGAGRLIVLASAQSQRDYPRAGR